MIDKRTISKESFLSILPKEELQQLKKCQDKWSNATCLKIAHGILTFIVVLVTYGFVSMCIESGYIDMTEFIAASMMFPDAVLRWFQSVDINRLVNLTWPFTVIAGIVLLVVKLRKPDKD